MGSRLGSKEVTRNHPDCCTEKGLDKWGVELGGCVTSIPKTTPVFITGHGEVQGMMGRWRNVGLKGRGEWGEKRKEGEGEGRQDWQLDSLRLLFLNPSMCFATSRSSELSPKPPPGRTPRLLKRTGFAQLMRNGLARSLPITCPLCLPELSEP